MCCDIKVKDIDAGLSFVQSQVYSTVRPAVQGFDIDICQVMYDIQNGTAVVQHSHI